MMAWRRGKASLASRCACLPFPARRLVPALPALLLAAALTAIAAPARAQMGSDRYGAMVLDAASGTVLSAMNPDEPRYPASLTKLMTLYMVFEALRDRRVALDTPVPVSVYAAAMEPSKLGLVPGTRLTVEQAILGLVTKSANDAAAALGELLGGSEPRFADMMTVRAHALGMTRTTFRNASGLPDPDQVTTARDMGVLARRLVQDFPDMYHYFSTPSFAFHGHVILNHDRMLQTYPGADGMKTGYTVLAGHNLVTSAMRGGVRLIGVVLGAGSNAERDVDMREQLDAGFQRMDVAPETGPALPALVATAQASPNAVIAHPPLRPAPRVARAATAQHGPQSWGVQIGAFATMAAARQAVTRAGADPADARFTQVTVHGRRLWRVQIFGMSQAEAASVCAAQARRRAPCAMQAVNPKQLARS